jgi:prostaglandin-endoperoxide synthase 2
VFTEETFTRAGIRIISRTGNLQQILARNAASPADAVPRFTYASQGCSRSRAGG